MPVAHSPPRRAWCPQCLCYQMILFLKTLGIVHLFIHSFVYSLIKHLHLADTVLSAWELPFQGSKKDGRQLRR